eukprot:8109413-Lingulodinium_polyedra.AAC.1
MPGLPALRPIPLAGVPACQACHAASGPAAPPPRATSGPPAACLAADSTRDATDSTHTARRRPPGCRGARRSWSACTG